MCRPPHEVSGCASLGCQKICCLKFISWPSGSSWTWNLALAVEQVWHYCTEQLTLVDACVRCDCARIWFFTSQFLKKWIKLLGVNRLSINLCLWCVFVISYILILTPPWRWKFHLSPVTEVTVYLFYQVQWPACARRLMVVPSGNTESSWGRKTALL